MYSLTLTLIAVGLGMTIAKYPYYGRVLQKGWGDSSDVEGDIYIVDSSRFQVINFKFNSSSRDAAFMLGTTKTYAEVLSGNGTDADATVIANPDNKMEALKTYSGTNVVLSLPDETSITYFTYIAVGYLDNKEMIGGADIPGNVKVPAPKGIGVFSYDDHQVGSGPVTVIDDRTIFIESFTYDGEGPDAYFYVGKKNSAVDAQMAPYGIIPDENGNTDPPGRYNGVDITLTLPDTISATDLGWLSMYCVQYDHDFGHVTFSNRLIVPPFIEPAPLGNETEKSCEPMGEDLQVSWSIVDNKIQIELAGRIERNTDYMAFGLSGSETEYKMYAADVVVVDYTEENNFPRAIDYYINDYAQCADNGVGVCPDNISSISAVNDAVVLDGKFSQGVTRVSYTRPLTTADISNGGDKEYKIDGTQQQVVWAIGPLATAKVAAKHFVGGRTEENTAIDFGRAPVDNCPIFEPKDKVDLPEFKPHHLYGKEGMIFTADIGLSVSKQGYTALTGLPSWGIAWYINGILIPELHLLRGQNYTFRVGGGDDPSKGSKYHPLYFTDSQTGGYDKAGNGAIYPARENGQLKNFSVGSYCGWNLNLDAEEKVYQCFEDLQPDIYLECKNDSYEYTEFVFTPLPEHPDTIYYQCYTHENLGWKIHLYDELPVDEIPDIDCTASNTTTISTSTTTAAIATGSTASTADSTLDATTNGNTRPSAISSTSTAKPTTTTPLINVTRDDEVTDTTSIAYPTADIATMATSKSSAETPTSTVGAVTTADKAAVGDGGVAAVPSMFMCFVLASGVHYLF